MQANKRQPPNPPGGLYMVHIPDMLNDGEQGKHRNIYECDTVQLGLIRALQSFNIARPYRQHWYLL
jgi:hypothetical protein